MTTLLARLLLLTRLDQPGVTNVTSVPARKGPILDDLGVHDYFDVYVEERDDLEVLEFIVADLL